MIWVGAETGARPGSSFSTGGEERCRRSPIALPPNLRRHRRLADHSPARSPHGLLFTGARSAKLEGG